MSAWLVTTLVAWYCIRIGRKEQHRQWMTRSFAVALVFLEVRVIAGLGGWDGNVHAIEAIVWLCNGLTLLGADLVIQTQEFLKNKNARTAGAGRARNN
jgi:hypothetical protein